MSPPVPGLDVPSAELGQDGFPGNGSPSSSLGWGPWGQRDWGHHPVPLSCAGGAEEGSAQAWGAKKEQSRVRQEGPRYPADLHSVGCLLHLLPESVSFGSRWLQVAGQARGFHRLLPPAGGQGSLRAVTTPQSPQRPPRSPGLSSTESSWDLEPTPNPNSPHPHRMYKM